MNEIQSTWTKSLTKKQARKLVYEKLAGALAEYKTGFSEKRFENNLKKASKLFATDIAKAARKENGKKVKMKKKKEEKEQTEQPLTQQTN
ncbi:MAG TPA: hypothetical protein VET23_06925 [Chitinophagaceae bacterium]|nr:hypothetical protein [Chitinophagaceae bacterium]